MDSTNKKLHFIHRSESTPNEQALKLLSIIEGRGSRALGDFVSVLLNSERHNHLAEMLRGQGEAFIDSPITPGKI